MDNNILKIEMHLHTKGNSSCAHANSSVIVDEYSKKGYSAIVCTNHLNENSWHYLKGFFKKTKISTFIKGYDDLVAKAKEKNIKVFFGLELGLCGEDYRAGRKNCVEILVYGITREEFLEYNTMLIYLSHKQLFELANKRGWVLIQSHPFRPQTKQMEEFVHGAEVFNGHKKHNNNNDLAKEFADSFHYVETCGSDYHDPNMANTAIMVNKLPNDEKELANLLQSKEYELWHE